MLGENVSDENKSEWEKMTEIKRAVEGVIELGKIRGEIEEGPLH
jgi:hypothetical protein